MTHRERLQQVADGLTSAAEMVASLTRDEIEGMRAFNPDFAGTAEAAMAYWDVLVLLPAEPARIAPRQDAAPAHYRDPLDTEE